MSKTLITIIWVRNNLLEFTLQLNSPVCLALILDHLFSDPACADATLLHRMVSSGCMRFNCQFLPLGLWICVPVCVIHTYYVFMSRYVKICQAFLVLCPWQVHVCVCVCVCVCASWCGYACQWVWLFVRTSVSAHVQVCEHAMSPCMPVTYMYTWMLRAYALELLL